jgi:translation initiation factor 3 subunit J
MDDWENEDFDNIKLPAVKNQWDDEDVESEEEIKESWDDSDEEKPKPKPVSPKPAPKINPKQHGKKLTKAQQRKASEEKKAKEKKLREEFENETLEQRKLREARIVQEADFQNTLDLFGADAIVDNKGISDDIFGDDDNDNDNNDAEKEKKVFIEEIKPKTKEDFVKYAETVYEELSRYDKNQFYNAMLDTLLKKISEPMEIANVRKLISTLQLEITNKQKAQAKKKKTPKKATIKQAYDNDIISDDIKYKYYDDGADDYDFI